MRGKNSQSDLASSIESLVADRRTLLAQRQINSYLWSHSSSPSSVFEACEWFRRLGLYRDGLALVAADEFTRKSYSTTSDLGRRLLWKARFLNLLGAGRFALDLARRLKVRKAEEHWIVANIYLVNFEPAMALQHFQAIDSAPGELRDYSRRIAKISLADSAADMANWDLAFETIEKVLKESSEPLLIGIANQARGEYFARTRRFDRAFEALTLAEKHIPSSEKTGDRGVLCKWMGYVLAKRGDSSSSQKYFLEAKRHLMKAGTPPEAWLDILRLQHEIGELPDHEYERIAHFPGLAPGFRSLFASRPLSLGIKTAALDLDLDRDEYRDLSDRYLGISSELKLLSFLRIVEDWGLPIERALCALWPEDAHVYDSLEGRFHQLLLRLRRHHGFSIVIKDRVLRLCKKDLASVNVRVGGKDPRPSFLSASETFAGGDVSSYYRISRTQRSLYLREWTKNGWIRAHGRAPRLVYEVIGQ